MDQERFLAWRSPLAPIQAAALSPEENLAIAVIWQAYRDALEGDAEALGWFRSEAPDTATVRRYWLEVLGAREGLFLELIRSDLRGIECRKSQRERLEGSLRDALKNRAAASALP